MPRALNGSMSIRSIFPESRRPSSELEPALELRRRPLGAECDLEAARFERDLRHGLVTNEGFEVHEQRLAKLGLLEWREIEANSRLDRVVEAATDQRERGIEVRRA